jgi:MGT family glycosyltransferase
MEKYVFMNIPAYGHVNPTLAVAQELVRRRENVVYYLTEDFREVVEATGATFRAYQPFMKPQSASQAAARPQAPNEAEGRPALTRDNRDDIYEMLERVRAEQADVIIYDALHLWARSIAEALHVPAILTCPMFVSHEKYNPLKEHLNLLNGQVSLPIPIPPVALERIQARINEMRARYHLSVFDMRDFYTHAEPLNIAFMPRVFHPAGDLFDERYVFVGPSLSPYRRPSPFPLEKLDNQRNLYISFGPVFNDHPDFFRLCFEAFEAEAWQVVLAYGSRVEKATLGIAPANFLLAAYAPQLEVLQKSQAFVSHGGMNSIMESLYYGMPLVVLPQTPEQKMNARRIIELGLGAAFDLNNLTAESLREAVREISSHPEILRNVQKMQKIVREAGSYRLATDTILAFAQKYPIDQVAGSHVSA